MTIEFQTYLVREPLTHKSEDWRETAYEWLVKINQAPFEYYTGSGLVDKLKHPKKPTLDDVLHSLVNDAEAENMSFQDWCDNFGYDTDSRKALDLYLLCQENAQRLRKAGVNIEAERERLANY